MSSSKSKLILFIDEIFSKSPTKNCDINKTIVLRFDYTYSLYLIDMKYYDPGKSRGFWTYFGSNQ